jgi:transcriptional regulator with XRE-family HTH domain
MDLGSAIKNIRRQKQQTQGEFAAKCGITQAYLSRIENNQKEPNLSILRTISEQLEIPLPILFFLSMNENDVPEKKRAAFKLVSPSVKSLVNEFFAV